MTESTTGRYLAICGAVCQLGPVVGLAGTMIEMKKSFGSLESGLAGGVAGLSDSIGHSMMSAVVGLIVGFIGLILLTVSITRCGYRAEWLFWFLIIYGVLALTAIPIGTAFGIFFLVYCLTKQHEFLRPNSEIVQSSPSQP